MLVYIFQALFVYNYRFIEIKSVCVTRLQSQVVIITSIFRQEDKIRKVNGVHACIINQSHKKGFDSKLDHLKDLSPTATYSIPKKHESLSQVVHVHKFIKLLLYSRRAPRRNSKGMREPGQGKRSQGRCRFQATFRLILQFTLKHKPHHGICPTWSQVSQGVTHLHGYRLHQQDRSSQVLVWAKQCQQPKCYPVKKVSSSHSWESRHTEGEA